MTTTDGVRSYWMLGGWADAAEQEFLERKLERALLGAALLRALLDMYFRNVCMCVCVQCM